jgi:hypothetical protein
LLETGFSTVACAKEIKAGRSEDLVAFGREPPFREDLSPEAAIVRSRYQAATSEDTVDWKNLTCDL